MNVSVWKQKCGELEIILEVFYLKTSDIKYIHTVLKQFNLERLLILCWMEERSY